MRTSTWLVLAGLLAAAACGGPRLDTRTFRLNHLDGGEAAQLISPYVFVDRKDAPGQMNSLRGSITVRETPDNLDKIARVLAEYDRAKPSVRLRFQIIQANGAAAADPAIAEVEASLRKLFRFRGYRLVAEALAGGMEGIQISQVVAGLGGPYHIRANIFDVRGSGDSGSVRVNAELNAPGATSLSTTVTLRAGQTAVLGNTQLGEKLGTLILTVRPELVQN